MRIQRPQERPAHEQLQGQRQRRQSVRKHRRAQRSKSSRHARQEPTEAARAAGARAARAEAAALAARTAGALATANAKARRRVSDRACRARKGGWHCSALGRKGRVGGRHGGACGDAAGLAAGTSATVKCLPCDNASADITMPPKRSSSENAHERRGRRIGRQAYECERKYQDAAAAERCQTSNRGGGKDLSVGRWRRSKRVRGAHGA